MFQMIDQSSAEPADRKILLYKIGMFISGPRCRRWRDISLCAVPKLQALQGYR
jgi:hypothetical protein